jgi:predicted homoserine dehydrogenase-like protein
MMNLFRFVKSIGYQPRLVGNIKGLQDFYRTPATQKGFAEQHGISPQMATSFADGTKISMENAIVANATGFKVARRGMYGPRCKHVNEAVNLFPLEKLMETGLVDFILGAEPGPGVFVLGYNDHPERKGYMRYFKMGDGPLYAFYVPYHLPHLEVPLTAARAVLFNDAAVTPIGGPVCDVVTIAKRDLKAGEHLDGIGGFTCYGMIDNYEVSLEQDLLPMGLSEGCLLKNDVIKDHAITNADVVVPANRLCDKLRAEQTLFFRK